MVLELNNGTIKIVQDSCEKKEEALIYLRFKDSVISNKTQVKFFIDDKPITEIKSNIWKIDHSIHTGKENFVLISITDNGISKMYKGNFIIQNYVSFGVLGEYKVPQVLLDMNNKIALLEKRIKDLESKFTVI